MMPHYAQFYRLLSLRHSHPLLIDEVPEAHFSGKKAHEYLES